MTVKIFTNIKNQSIDFFCDNKLKQMFSKTS